MAFRITFLACALTFLIVWFWLGDTQAVYSFVREQPPSGATIPCTVTSVWDGDGPIHCREGGKIRLTAIAARELD